MPAKPRGPEHNNRRGVNEMEERDRVLDAPEIKHLAARYWDERAPVFDDGPQHVSQSDEETAEWKGILGRLLPAPGPLSVLDVGTGTGFLAFLLAEMGHQVTGVDLSGQMLAQARGKAGQLRLNVAFQEADAEDTGFPDDAFDLVVSRHLIWNLPRPEAAIREWARIAKPGGAVAVINGIFGGNKDRPNRWEPPYRAAFERLPLAEGVPPETLAALMNEQGLSDTRFEWLNALAEVKRHTLPEGHQATYAPNRRYVVVGRKPRAG